MDNDTYIAQRGLVACKKASIVYCNISKCACTTIKNILYYLDEEKQYESPLDIHHVIGQGASLINFRNPAALLYAIERRKISFTFVRHPLKRIYSCFNEKIFYQSRHSFPRLRHELIAGKYNLQFPENNEPYQAEEHANNFLRFLLFVRDNISNGPNRANSKLGTHHSIIEEHWIPQSIIIDNYRQYTEIDFIGRVENYRDDMKYVLNAAAVQNTEPLLEIKYNEGAAPPYKLHEILTDEIIELGQEIYKKDYYRFNYSTT